MVFVVIDNQHRWHAFLIIAPVCAVKGPVGGQQHRAFGGGQRFSKQETLGFVAAIRGEKGKLCLGFDALCDHFQAQAVCEIDDCARD